jgi:hypothetical protein
MLPHIYLFAVISLFLAFVVKADENYNIVNDLATQRRIQLDMSGRTRYAIYEKRHAENSAQECCVGFDHIGLVVGHVERRDGEYTFNASTFHMLKQGGIAGQLYGGKTIAAYNNKPWVANHFIKNGVLTPVPIPNTYTWAGPVKSSLDRLAIQEAGTCKNILTSLFPLTGILQFQAKSTVRGIQPTTSPPTTAGTTQSRCMMRSGLNSRGSICRGMEDMGCVLEYTPRLVT